jgi:hypothetical protein
MAAVRSDITDWMKGPEDPYDNTSVALCGCEALPGCLTQDNALLALQNEALMENILISRNGRNYMTSNCSFRYY